VKIHLATIGRLKESYFVAADEEYRKRLRPYCTLTVHEAKDEAAMLAALPSGVHLYAFDERGEALSSAQFAELLAAEAQQRLAKGELDVALRYARASRVLEPDHRKVAAIGAEVEAAVRTALERSAMRPSDVPTLTRPLAELARLQLSPQEGFLLSRVDGVQNLAAILKMGPMNPTDAQLLLRKLIDAGHVRLSAKS